MDGKVSRVRRDNKGCFKDIPQGIQPIRYHPLSAQPGRFPQDLVLTSATEESNVIVGVRHRKYTLEAVQYHPESILPEGGDELFANFLKLRGRRTRSAAPLIQNCHHLSFTLLLQPRREGVCVVCQVSGVNRLAALSLTDNLSTFASRYALAVKTT